MKSKNVQHHPRYNGAVFSTVEDEIESLFSDVADLQEGELTSTFFLSGDISPAALSGNVDDYNPTGLATATILRLDGGAGDRNITGLAGGADGRVIVIYNVGATNSLILKGEDGASTAANRFVAGDIAIRSMGGVSLWYDSTSSRWRPTVPRLATNTGLSGGSATGLISLALNDLTEETSIDGAADFVAFYDTSAAGHRKAKPQNLGLQSSRSSYTALSSTITTLTGIPATAKQVVLNLAGVSWNNTAQLRIRIGPSGGVATSGYLGAASGLATASLATALFTAGIDGPSAAAVAVYHGHLIFTLADTATNTWVFSGVLGHSDGAAQQLFGGQVPLSGVLERIAITTVAGTATADAGSASWLAYW